MTTSFRTKNIIRFCSITLIALTFIACGSKSENTKEISKEVSDTSITVTPVITENNPTDEKDVEENFTAEITLTNGEKIELDVTQGEDGAIILDKSLEVKKDEDGDSYVVIGENKVEVEITDDGNIVINKDLIKSVVTITPGPTKESTPSVEPTNNISPTEIAVNEVTASPTPTITPSKTATVTVAPTSTPVPTKPVATATPTKKPTSTPTSTPVPTATPTPKPQNEITAYIVKVPVIVDTCVSSCNIYGEREEREGWLDRSLILWEFEHDTAPNYPYITSRTPYTAEDITNMLNNGFGMDSIFSGACGLIPSAWVSYRYECGVTEKTVDVAMVGEDASGNIAWYYTQNPDGTFDAQEIKSTIGYVTSDGVKHYY